MTEERESFLSEVVILVLLGIGLACAIIGRVIAPWFCDWSLGLVGILVVRRGLKGVTSMVIERSKITASAQPAKSSLDVVP